MDYQHRNGVELDIKVLILYPLGNEVELRTPLFRFQNQFHGFSTMEERAIIK